MNENQPREHPEDPAEGSEAQGREAEEQVRQEQDDANAEESADETR